MRPLLCLALLAVSACTSDPRFDRLVDSLSPWPTFGSSRRLISATSPLAPSTGLTMHRVADDGAETQAAPLRTEPGDVWPAPEQRRNTLAEFERSLHDGSTPPPPPRNATP